MNKKILILSLTIILIILSLILIIYSTDKKNTTDAIKFKEEYESLNNTIREKDGKNIRSIEIPKNNPFIYKKAENIVEMIENKETFIVYFGFNDCPWCRSIVPTLTKVANDLKIEKIYYVDVKKIRDTIELQEDEKLETTKKGSKGYYELLDKFNNVLDNYTLTNKDGNTIQTGEKRIFAPNIVAVLQGEPTKITSGISDMQTDGYMKLTKEITNDSYNKLKEVLELIKDKNLCNSNSKC